jgi:hypothetical protein
MILQQRGNSQVVYMPDIDAGHIVLGEKMGLCDILGKPALHATIEKTKYTTDCGVAVDAWHMVGETVNIHVIPSKVKIAGKSGDDMVKALNSFNSPRYDFDRYVFVGKFAAEQGRQTFTDKNGRKISTCQELIKDIPGIYNLMTHLGENNGALFHPVIARYMWGIWHMRGRPAKLQPVGYIDLHEYLQVLRDDRRNMFSRRNGDAAISIQLGQNPTVEITGVDQKTNQAILSLNDVVVIDREKDRTFKPYVLVANRPFELRQELQFRWTRVMFKDTPVFLMPVMSLQSTWGTMTNMINLLSASQI